VELQGKGKGKRGFV